MNLHHIFKVLANEHRYQILQWLKEPEKHFPPHACQPPGFHGGVAVGLITEKSGLAQSVVSAYLKSMKKAGLLQSKRAGKWTYYRYHREGIVKLLERAEQEL